MFPTRCIGLSECMNIEVKTVTSGLGKSSRLAQAPVSRHGVAPNSSRNASAAAGPPVSRLPTPSETS